MMKTNAGIYIHIPFCRQKCAYCDFYSLPCLDLIEAYTKALCAQIATERKGKDLRYDSVFFGGGTPSALGTQNLCKIAKTLKENFEITENAEWSLEVNPKTVTKEDLLALRKAGFCRVSIGVQSFCDAELKALGRIHTAKDAKETVRAAREAGFSSVSIDLMYGIPHQTKGSFADSLTQAIALDVDHLSAYGLKIEAGTPFARCKQETLDLPDEEAEREMYFSMIAFLEQNGLAQYEISNFAKKGFECRHNLKYWTMQPYLAFGPASHGFLGNLRYETAPNLQAYLDCAKQGDFSTVIKEEERLTEADLLCEYTMLHMRTKQGVDDADFEKRFSKTFADCYGERAARYRKANLLRHENGRWYFSKEGFYVSNYILSDLLEF
jgi:oxygen-independent coproporphyrinogen-3 oxidase